MEKAPTPNYPKDEWEKLQEDRENVADRMIDEKDTEIDSGDILQLTSFNSTIEGVEQYLKDNFDKLTQIQRDYLLTSLRIKKFKKDAGLPES